MNLYIVKFKEKPLYEENLIVIVVNAYHSHKIFCQKSIKCRANHFVKDCKLKRKKTLLLKDLKMMLNLIFKKLAKVFDASNFLL
jgi:hypothetical protein